MAYVTDWFRLTGTSFHRKQALLPKLCGSDNKREDYENSCIGHKTRNISWYRCSVRPTDKSSRTIFELVESIPQTELQILFITIWQEIFQCAYSKNTIKWSYLNLLTICYLCCSRWLLQSKGISLQYFSCCSAITIAPLRKSVEPESPLYSVCPHFLGVMQRSLQTPNAACSLSLNFNLSERPNRYLSTFNFRQAHKSYS